MKIRRFLSKQSISIDSICEKIISIFLYKNNFYFIEIDTCIPISEANRNIYVDELILINIDKKVPLQLNHLELILFDFDNIDEPLKSYIVSLKRQDKINNLIFQ